LHQFCTPPDEYGSEDSSINEKKGKKDDFCDQPSFSVPEANITVVEVEDIHDTCKKHDDGGDGRKQAETAVDFSKEEFLIPVLFCPDSLFKNPPAPEGCEKKSKTDEMKKKIDGTIHKHLAVGIVCGMFISCSKIRK
jgi:hypothetical protein